MRARLSTPGLVWRAIRSSVGGLVIIGVTAAVVTATAVAGPRATMNVLTADLHYRLSSAGPPTRDLQSSSGLEPYTFDGEPISTAKTIKSTPPALRDIRNSMPVSLRSIAGTGRYVGRDEGEAGHGVLASGPPDKKLRSSYSYSIEANPDLRSDAILVAGRWPAPVRVAYSPAPIELVTTVAAARTFSWKIGQTQQMAMLGTGETALVKLVGTIRPRDPLSDYWQLDGSRERASITTSIDGDSLSYFGTVWMDAASWPTVSDEFAGQALRTWYPIRSRSLELGQIDPLSGALHRFLAKTHTIGTGNASAQLRYTTNLGTILDDYLARAGAGNAVLAVVEAGPIGTGAALLLLAILSLVDRRRRAIELLRARGASAIQFRMEVATQVAAATVPGSVIGALIAVLATGGSMVGAAIVVVAAVAVLPAVFAGAAAGRAPTVLQRGGVARPSRWRWVVDSVLVLLASLGLVVLVQRGLTTTGGGLGTDPLLAATPVLVAAAACAIVLRAVPLILRVLGRATRRGRGVIRLVGRANSARAGAQFLPVFAILTGLSVSIFAASILGTERSGIREAAVDQVGADISVTGAPFTNATITRLRALPGIADLAAIDSPGAVSITGQNQTVALYSVNARDLAAVEAVLPPDRQYFNGLGTTRNGRSLALAGGLDRPTGKVLHFDDTKSPPVSIIAKATPPPKFIDGVPWLLVDTSAVPRVSGLSHNVTTVIVRVVPGSDQVVLQRQIQSIAGPREKVVVADAQVRALTSAPLVGGIESLTLVAVILSLLLCVLALMLTLVMGTRDRDRLLGRLRAIGFSRRQSTGLVGWEIGPMTALGILAGTTVGVSLPVIFLSVVDLSTFIGASEPPQLVIDPAFVGVAILAFALSAVCAVIVTAGLSARRKRSVILREPGTE